MPKFTSIANTASSEHSDNWKRPESTLAAAVGRDGRTVCVCVCAFQKLRCEQQVGANGRRQGAEPFLNPFYQNSIIRLSSERQGPSLLLPLRQPIFELIDILKMMRCWEASTLDFWRDQNTAAQSGHPELRRNQPWSPTWGVTRALNVCHRKTRVCGTPDGGTICHARHPNESDTPHGSSNFKQRPKTGSGPPRPRKVRP